MCCVVSHRFVIGSVSGVFRLSGLSSEIGMGK